MAKDQVLFCPFCGESFEGARMCPEHELALVPFHKLPDRPSEPDDNPQLGDDTKLALFDPRFGRAHVALGALLNGLSLLLELVRFNDDEHLRVFVAATALPSLWTLGLQSFVLLFILQRRRTLRELRGLRVLVPALSLAAPFAVFWTLNRLAHGAAPWLTHGHGEFHAGTAVYSVLIAALWTAAAGTRLGVVSQPTRNPSVSE